MSSRMIRAGSDSVLPNMFKKKSKDAEEPAKRFIDSEGTTYLRYATRVVPYKKAEDRLHVCDQPLLDAEGTLICDGFAVVCDGHGGAQAAEHCVSNMASVLQEEALRLRRSEEETGSSNEAPYEVWPSWLNLAVLFTFRRLHNSICDDTSTISGCTMTLLLFMRGKGVQQLHLKVAWVGDSRAVSIEKKKLTKLTEDHRLSNVGEKIRIDQMYSKEREERGQATQADTQSPGKPASNPVPISVNVQQPSRSLYAKPVPVPQRNSASPPDIKLGSAPPAMMLDASRKQSVVIPDRYSLDGIEERPDRSMDGQRDGDTPRKSQSATVLSEAAYTLPGSMPSTSSKLSSASSKLSSRGSDIDDTESEEGGDGEDTFDVNPAPRLSQEKKDKISIADKDFRQSFMGVFVDHKGNELPHGGERIFSSINGSSLQVTRSIGDRLGARSVTCDPEILDYTFASSVRLVVASDGLWDCLYDPKGMRLPQTISQDKLVDPNLAATELVKIRTNDVRNLAMPSDDLSFIVVDFIPPAPVSEIPIPSGTSSPTSIEEASKIAAKQELITSSSKAEKIDEKSAGFGCSVC